LFWMILLFRYVYLVWVEGSFANKRNRLAVLEMD
jgi:hypothetical protein